MGLLDIDEEVEDILLPEGEYVEEEENIYLRNADQALALMGKIFGAKRNSYTIHKRIQKIDQIMDQDLLNVFAEIQLADEVQMHKKLNQLSDKLVDQKRMKLLKDKAVVGLGGKFSAGKSKFINSIFRVENFLPEAQNPTTSIPTYVLQSDKECIRAYTYENEEILLNEEGMKALTHKFFEKFQVGFSSFISSLIIERPEVPYRNIAFLDTPGYTKYDVSTKKSVSDNQKAFEQLKTVDYLIWLVDIENGVVTQKDLEFISSLQMEQVLIVFNKADKKDDDSIRQIIENSKLMVKNAGIPCYGITAYSSTKGIEWFGYHWIKDFLQEASAKKIGKEDLSNQISQIETEISFQLEQKRRAAENERNALSEIIFRSNNILEIETLVDMYSDSLEYYRTIQKSSSKFLKTKTYLNSILEKHLEEG